MAVQINDMEMPKSCADCLMMQDEYVSCRLTGSWEWTDEFIPSKERLKDCPLIEVPEPHGDLIDRDALLKGEGRYMISLSKCGIDINEIERAPTIIPASKEVE